MVTPGFAEYTLSPVVASVKLAVVTPNEAVAAAPVPVPLKLTAGTVL
jgi:hypothetical protein